MNILRLIKYVYVFLTIFVFFSVLSTTMTVIDVLPGVFLMWVCYFCFYTGYISKCINGNDSHFYTNCTNNKKVSTILDFFARHRFVCLIIAYIFSILISIYYTGNTPLSVLSSIIQKKSLYFDYQQYFAENKLGTFTLSKLPYIIMNAALNLIFVIGVLSTILSKQKLKKIDFIYLFFISLAFLYFGIARGTNFELFELICVYIFAVSIKISRSSRKQKRFVLLLSVLLAVVGIIAFSITMSRRGYSGSYVTDEIRYDPDGFFSILFPEISALISKLTAYFGFGFRFTSCFINDYLLENPSYLLASVFPFGLVASGQDPITAVSGLISCGTNWRPDIVYFIGYTGFLGLFLITFLFGRFYFYITHSQRFSNTLIANMVSYYLFLQFFSLPIGNFIRVSSANKLIVFGLLMLFLLSCVLKKKSTHQIIMTSGLSYER